MRRPLSNPVESLGGAEKPENYREHGTRIGDLVAPRADWSSLASLRRALRR